jgi:hypothetical protein
VAFETNRIPARSGRGGGKLITGEVGEHIGATSDLFADLVEKDIGRLKNGRRNLFVTRPPETIERSWLTSASILSPILRPWLKLCDGR